MVRSGRRFLLSMFGQSMYAASQWAIVIFVAKHGTPEEVGQYMLVLAIATPIFLFMGMQLRNIVATDHKVETAFRHVMAFRLVTAALAITMALIGARAVYGETIFRLMIGMALFKAFEQFGDLAYGVWQKEDRFDRIAASNAAKSVLMVAAAAVIPALGGSLAELISFLAVSGGLIYFAYDLRLLAIDGDIRPRFHFHAMSRLLRLSFPLGVVIVLNSLGANIPRYFMNEYGGLTELGIFGALSVFLFGYNMVVNAAGQAYVSQMAKHAVDGDYANFNRIVWRLLLVFVCIGTIGWCCTTLWGETILSRIFTEEYSHDAPAFRWIAAAAVMSAASSILGYALTAIRAFAVQVPLNLLFIVILSVSCMLWIPEQGILGAAKAVALYFGIQIPVKALWLWQRIRRSSERPESEGRQPA